MQCAAGEYCPDGITSIPCSPGDFCDYGSSQRKKCEIGKFCPFYDYEFPDRSQVKLDTSSSIPSKAAESARVMYLCPAGFFCAAASSFPALCPAGHFCPEGTTSPPTCPAGFACPAGSMTPQPCLAGSYCVGKGRAFGLDCPPGYFCRAGATAPVRCPAGHFCPGAAGFGQLCVAGTYCRAGVSAQTVCPAGSYCPAGSSAPTRCLTGQFCGLQGMQRPEPCPAGAVCPHPASPAAPCPKGHYCAEGAGPARCAEAWLCPQVPGYGLSAPLTCLRTVGKALYSDVCPDTCSGAECLYLTASWEVALCRPGRRSYCVVATNSGDRRATRTLVPGNRTAAASADDGARVRAGVPADAYTLAFLLSQLEPVGGDAVAVASNGNDVLCPSPVSPSPGTWGHHPGSPRCYGNPAVPDGMYLPPGAAFPVACGQGFLCAAGARVQCVAHAVDHGSWTQAAGSRACSTGGSWSDRDPRVGDCIGPPDENQGLWGGVVKAAGSPWDGRRNECAPTKVGDACLGAYWLCGLTVKIVRGAFVRPEPPLPPVS